MTPAEWVVVVLGSGTVGAIVKSVGDWLLARDDKRIAREQAIAEANNRRIALEQAIGDANDKVAEQLRNEIREENEKLRERLRQSDDRISRLIGQVEQQSKDNQALRDENLKLARQAGQESQLVGELIRVNADQALKLSTLENELGAAKDRIGVLEAALRDAKIPVPEPRRRGDTGPLTSAAGA